MKKLHFNSIQIFIAISLFLTVNAYASPKAEEYSEKDFLLKKDWKLVFSDSLVLNIGKIGPKAIEIWWSGSKQMKWIQKDLLAVNPKDFTTLDQSPFEDFAENQYQIRLSEYEKRKTAWDASEKSRFQKEMGIWNLKKDEYRKKYAEKLGLWEKEKLAFDKEEDNRLAEELKEYEEKSHEKDQEYLEDLREWQEKKKIHDAEEKARIKKETDELVEEYSGKIKELNEENQLDSNYTLLLEKIKKKGRKCLENKEDKNCYTELNRLKEESSKKNKIYGRVYQLESELRDKIIELKPILYRKSSSLLGMIDHEKPSIKGYTTEAPRMKRKQFKARPAKPQPFETIRPQPVSPRFFSENPPLKNRSPGFDISGLLLHLGRTSCRPESYQLRIGTSHYFVISKSSSTQGRSAWSDLGKRPSLKKCTITSKGSPSHEVNLTIVYHQNRPLNIETDNGDLISLRKIESPELVAFEEGLGEREFYLGDLFDFIKSAGRKERDVKATYAMTDSGNVKYLNLKYSANAEKLVKLEFKTYQYLFDSSTTNKNTVVNRVAYLQDADYVGGRNPFIRRHYWFYEGESSKKWQFLAKYRYGLLDDGILGNQITRLEKNASKGVSKQIVSATGLLLDFTSLWYIPAWYAANDADSVKLGFYDDSRIHGAVLKHIKGESETIFFKEFDKLTRKVVADKWVLQNTSDNRIMFTLLVGRKNNIVYSITSGDKRIDLIRIRSDVINRNIVWLQEQFSRNNFFVLTN